MRNSVNIPPLKVALSDIDTPVDESASVVAGSDPAESISQALVLIPCLVEAVQTLK